MSSVEHAGVMLRWLLMVRTDAKMADEWIKTRKTNATVKEFHQMLVDTIRLSRQIYAWLASIHNNPCVRWLMEHDFDKIVYDGAHRHLNRHDASGNLIRASNPCIVVKKKQTSQIFEIHKSGVPPVLFPVSVGGAQFIQAVTIFLKQSVYYQDVISNLDPVEEYKTPWELAEECRRVPKCESWVKEDLNCLSSALLYLQLRLSSFFATSSS
jgi:hypothetical protein